MLEGHHHRSKSRFAAVGLLGGLMLYPFNLSQADATDQRPYNGPKAIVNSPPRITDSLERELKGLLTDLGVPTLDIPIDFVQKVRRWVHLYQVRDRGDIERVLESQNRDFELVRQQVASAQLPPDLAFLTLVESHFRAGEVSQDNNAGLWQFTQGTARRCGLKVNATIDERLDPVKSTQAACRYLRRLDHELGQGSSLLLVLAAYNMGPSRLELRTRQMEDLSKRRDFWYLYRTHVLPALTRNHLARLMAAILIGRHPRWFGFTETAHRDSDTASTGGLSR